MQSLVHQDITEQQALHLCGLAEENALFPIDKFFLLTEVHQNTSDRSSTENSTRQEKFYSHALVFTILAFYYFIHYSILMDKQDSTVSSPRL